MNIVICDDEKIYLKSISEKIDEWARNNNCWKDVIIRTFHSSEDLLDAWENGLIIDILFLDIQIPNELSGLDIAKQIFEKDDTIPIVFVTNYSEYACDGYQVNALRYILKPFSFSEISECMNIAWNRWQLLQTNSITIKTKKQTYILPYKNIFSFESLGHYVVVRCINNTIIEYRAPFSVLQAAIDSDLFVRCHRSFIVNVLYIRRVQSSEVQLSNGQRIPIGKKYLNDFLNAFTRYYQGGEIV